MTDAGRPASPLRVSAQVHVAADPHEVWRLMTDWSRQHEWIWATQVRGGQGLGATVVGWTGVGPVGFTDTMVISEWDPPLRCVVRHTGRLVRGSGTFEVIPVGEEADFRWTEDLELPLPPAMGKMAGLVIRPVAEASLAASLRRFARLL
jgi:carbon monoxide dehydrogenase subunit G